MIYDTIKNDGAAVKPFTQKDVYAFYRKQKFGILNPAAKSLLSFFRRLTGTFSYEDQVNIACLCEVPKFFLNNGMMLPHPYGVTLSIDEIGCDCLIGQNVTIGSSGKDMSLDEYTKGHKPRIGNLVRVYPNAVISGEITIGDCVIITASSIITKNVPNKSIVYGVNQVKPLDAHHIAYLKSVLYHCDSVYKKVPGLMYKDDKMYINTGYLQKRDLLIKNIGTDKFPSILKELF